MSVSPFDEGDLAAIAEVAEYVAGWCAHEEALTDTKQRLANGDDVSVRWFVRDGKAAAGELLDVLVARDAHTFPHDQASFDHLRHLRAIVREYGGMVVVAARGPA